MPRCRPSSSEASSRSCSTCRAVARPCGRSGLPPYSSVSSWSCASPCAGSISEPTGPPTRPEASSSASSGLPSTRRERSISYALPGVACRVAQLVPRERVSSASRVALAYQPRLPLSLQVGLELLEGEAFAGGIGRRLPAEPVARLVVLVRRARLVVRPLAEVLPPVIALRDRIEILALAEAADSRP